MSEAWRERVRAALRETAPYHVPAVTVEVKLDANEHPYPPPPGLLDAIVEALRDTPLHRYPDPRASRLRALVADDLGQPGDRLVLGNGADELIALLCSTFGEPRPGAARASILYPAPSFVVFRNAAIASGLAVIEAPLGPGFAADADALDDAIARERPNLVFLATPNNPTGTVWPRPLVERLVERHPDVVMVLDQAYAMYGGDDFLDLVDRHPHCVVLRTYSKIGLAGLRLGVLVAQPQVAHEVEKVRPPYNLGLLPQRAAVVALSRFAGALRSHVAEVVAERERLALALAALPGVEVFPSGANLLLVRVADARRVWQSLLDHSVLVRRFDAGALADCLRITVGTPPENRRLLEALAAVL